MPYNYGQGYNPTNNNPQGVDWANWKNYVTYDPQADQQLLQNAPSNVKDEVRAFFGSEQYRGRVGWAQNQSAVSNRLGQLQDPTSQYYRNINQQIRDNLTSVYNPNSLLALARSSGLSRGGASTIANMQNKSMQKGINEYANKGTNQAFISAGSMIQGLLGLQSANNQFRETIEQNASMGKQQMENAAAIAREGADREAANVAMNQFGQSVGQLSYSLQQPSQPYNPYTTPEWG